jgi:uncharacterized protein YndB with AHSA1/START domain
MMSSDLVYSLERTILICAKRTTVFRFFTDSKRFADWWGEGSTIEGRVGGAVQIRFPNGLRAGGEILEIEPPEKIVFTYGYESGKPIPPGSSRVTIRLIEQERGTLLTLHHELSNEAARDEHVQGWRYQLSVFANAAANDQHADFQKRINGYFEIWNTADASTRRRKMDSVFDNEIVFHDQYSCTQGLEDLNSHLSAMQHFMPGLTIQQEGKAHHCQGAALARWTVSRKDGSEAGKGTNVFRFTPEGKLQAVTGFWG